MIPNPIKFILLLIFGLVALNAKASKEDQHLNVALRMIGHQVLLISGDSTSRVLAIENEADQYTINFESEFEFVPDDLIPMIGCIMEDAEIKNGYIVSVRDNKSQQIIYSFEVGKEGKLDLIPCRTRAQPKANYSILITMMGEELNTLFPNFNQPAFAQHSPLSTNKKEYRTPILIGSSIFLLIGLMLYSRKRKSAEPSEVNQIAIGDSYYDKRNMKLTIDGKTVELTHKEAELLLLLHHSANIPLEREEILKKVWDDEGDYIGRTLDVYISKLRKKIEPDSTLEIVNIRGVGYKLVINQ